MKQSAMRLAIAVSFSGLFLAATASAYSVSGVSAAPQSSVSSFSLDWGSFFGSLPTENFINSLESIGTNFSAESVTSAASTNTQEAQNFFQSIDNWFAQNLGFRPSAIFIVVLGIISWILGFLKGIVDWMIGFLR